MIEVWLGFILLLVVVTVVVEIAQFRRNVTIDLPRIQQSFESVEKSQQALAQSVRDELAKNREEAATVAGQSREELRKAIQGAADALNQNVNEVRETVEQRIKLVQEESAKRLELVREESLTSAKSLREAIDKAVKGFQESLAQNAGEAGQARKAQLEALSAKLVESATATGQKLDGVKASVETGLKIVQADSAKQLEQTRTAVQEKLQATEKRVGDSVQQITGRLDQMTKDVQSLAATVAGIGKQP